MTLSYIYIHVRPNASEDFLHLYLCRTADQEHMMCYQFNLLFTCCGRIGEGLIRPCQEARDRGDFCEIIIPDGAPMEFACNDCMIREPPGLLHPEEVQELIHAVKKASERVRALEARKHSTPSCSESPLLSSASSSDTETEAKSKGSPTRPATSIPKRRYKLKSPAKIHIARQSLQRHDGAIGRNDGLRDSISPKAITTEEVELARRDHSNSMVEEDHRQAECPMDPNELMCGLSIIKEILKEMDDVETMEKETIASDMRRTGVGTSMKENRSIRQSRLGGYEMTRTETRRPCSRTGGNYDEQRPRNDIGFTGHHSGDMEVFSGYGVPIIDPDTLTLKVEDGDDEIVLSGSFV
jgi:hypothetical protein